MKKILESVSELLESFIISVVLFILVYAFLAFPEIVIGVSMEPTLNQGDRLLVERITPKFDKLKRGDVVIFNPPGNNNIDYVKRIVGLPNEHLIIRDCKAVLISGTGEEKSLPESYIFPEPCKSSDKDLTINVEDKAYFVMGDNRNHSADSRFFGVVKRERIDGKVFIRFWPLNRLTVL